jgi:hypothetical protein
MAPEHPENSENLLFLTGLYTRVARQLGVHPSYVSRVARGERRSDRVYRAIAVELSKFRGHVLPDLEEDVDVKASKIAATREVRRQLAQKMKSDLRLRRLSVVVVEEDERSLRAYPRVVSPAVLSARIATNARLMGAGVIALERLSSRLERIPHVLSVLDSGAVVLYSCGTTGMARREHRIAGSDWSKDNRGASAAARAIAAGVPVAVMGAVDLHGTFTPSVRMACPIRLSDHSIAGVIVLTIEVTRARPEHMIDVSKVAKRLCKFVEHGPMPASRKRDWSSRIQPFAEAARSLAIVLSLPQVDPQTRVALSGVLAELETQGRQALQSDTTPRRGRNSASAKARGAV